MKKVYLDEIKVTVKLYNKKLEEGTLDNYIRILYCGRFLAILGIIRGDDELDLDEVTKWSAFLDMAATCAARGEAFEYEIKGI